MKCGPLFEDEEKKSAMAVYHMAVSVGSCGGGASAGSKDDYLEREGKYKEEEWEDPEAEHIEHGHMPEWATDDPHRYWAAADARERVNGTLYREVQFALPRELDPDQRRELAVGFAERLTGKENLPYTLALHRGGGENPHAHLMINERVNDGIRRSEETWFKRANSKHPERGGARKTRSLQGKRWLIQTRKTWEQEANRALANAGRQERIDCRSLADRRDDALERGALEEAAEFSREPGVHLGPQGLKTPDEKDPLPGVAAKAAAVEQRNMEMRWERTRVDEDLEKEKKFLKWLEAEIRRMVEEIQRAAERLAELVHERLQERDWDRGR